MATAMRKEFLKSKKMIHPNSRKSIAITKKVKKISNRQKGKMSRLIKQNLIGEKMLWIRNNMIPGVCPYTPELTASLLETYIARNDEEMEQIAIKRSIGNNRSRQHASRENIIRITKEREQEEYDTCGIEIPDILNATQCKMLMNWNNELQYINNFKFIRFGKNDLNKALVLKERMPDYPILAMPVNEKNLLNTRLFYLHLYLKRRKANSFVLFCLQNARDCISSCSYLQQKISHVTRYKSTIEEKRSCLIVKYSIKLKHVNESRARHEYFASFLCLFFIFSASYFII